MGRRDQMDRLPRRAHADLDFRAHRYPFNERTERHQRVVPLVPAVVSNEITEQALRDADTGAR